VSLGFFRWFGYPHVFPTFISPIQAGFNRKLPIQGEAVGLRPIGDKLNIKAAGVFAHAKKLTAHFREIMNKGSQGCLIQNKKLGVSKRS
jgi:hypothetical protein